MWLIILITIFSLTQHMGTFISRLVHRWRGAKISVTWRVMSSLMKLDPHPQAPLRFTYESLTGTFLATPDYIS